MSSSQTRKIGRSRPSNRVYTLNKTEQRRADDLRWAMQASEVLNHQGMFVVVYKQEVVAFDKNPTKARQQAERITGRPGSELVVLAVPAPSLRGIPH